MIGDQKISPLSFVSDIVNNDYRTVEVFRKYGIEYCCAGKWPLQSVCDAKGLDAVKIIKELEASRQTYCIPNTIQFGEWDIDFLVDYIINIHHAYLKKVLPETKVQLEEFAISHSKKIPKLTRLVQAFHELANEMLPHLQHEEDILFPYIRQIAHAFQNKESYAGLLVRTLRKPIENVMHHEHETVHTLIGSIRQLTDQYNYAPYTCIHHKVIFLKLFEIDNDLAVHLHLETDILFPQAIELEKKLLHQ
jgi:regulator of cell morphogenesis and NO signaling